MGRLIHVATGVGMLKCFTFSCQLARLQGASNLTGDIFSWRSPPSIIPQVCLCHSFGQLVATETDIQHELLFVFHDEPPSLQNSCK